MTRHSIAVVAFDRISPFHLAVPCIVFGEERGGIGVPSFDFRVCAAEPHALATSAGFTIAARHSLDALADADVIIVPSWRDPDELPSDALLDALRAAHARGAHVVGLCLGSYVLAAAGLLDGRAATTHWAWADDFARRYPRVRLDPNVLYIDDENITTSAGTAAGLDCCLHVLRRLAGSHAANQVARRLVVPPHRQGSQAQFIDEPVPERQNGEKLAGLLDWLRANLQTDHSLDALAARMAMSRRNFTRRFRETTGATVGAWLVGQRVALAQRLLEDTDLPIDRIAERSGFRTGATLRQQFAGTLKTSPSAYRRAFRGT
ncbi:helix-turn-helix domain-containing protein [Caballeronia novacaledonica]|jgi:transcriptional regulator GlxA family with amidase domain|uniref:Helix-turn-helix domain-containing protein n=1 Tax=Caballeronia novacaledonica TaxID=1544861 RepID=A0AA37IBD0_9BURK|nr:helix-turn-helix domain-containing protein [Caballeronia novacaledonica]GJH23501.1 helix-turn-helix domain-containing protein [Caballeronia novacaledonica]